jgi:hypothetical protein
MNYRIIIIEISILFLISLHSKCQYKYSLISSPEKPSLTGNIQYDLTLNAKDELNTFDSTNTRFGTKKYSSLRAGLYSAFIPGAGQLYTKSYWQSAAFLGAEVLMWIIYSKYEDKGDRQTELFQQYADQHWSVVDYVNWIRDPQNFGNIINDNPIIPGTENLPAWQRVDWDKLNTIEMQIAGDQSIQPTGFTHKLDRHGEQQYYEMIGKYQQFGGGWDDASTFKAGGFTKADIISATVSPRFLEYSQMRGDANSFYNIATTVSYVIVANHIFSALEAAWNASKINHKIELQGHIQSRIIYRNMVEYVPTLHVKYEL